MMEIDDKTFEEMVGEAIEEMPQPHLSHLKNVAIVIADYPNDEQRQRLHLHDGQTLYGLYEGVPLPARGGYTGTMLPDKITIFKLPLSQRAQDLKQLKAAVRHTVWHEIAHYFGLDHDRIHELEKKSEP